MKSPLRMVSGFLLTISALAMLGLAAMTPGPESPFATLGGSVGVIAGVNYLREAPSGVRIVAGLVLALTGLWIFGAAVITPGGGRPLTGLAGLISIVMGVVTAIRGLIPKSPSPST